MSSQRPLRPRRGPSQSPRVTRQSSTLVSEPGSEVEITQVKARGRPRGRPRRQLSLRGSSIASEQEEDEVQFVPASTITVVASHAPKLATVDEDDADVAVQTADLQLEDENHRLGSVSAGSAHSGTSTEQIEELQGKAQQLLRLLPTLASSSQSIITAIRSELVSEAASAKFPEELNLEESNLKSMFKIFNNTYEHYPAITHHWSNPNHILQALAPARKSEDDYGILDEQLTYLMNTANLAKLMHEVLIESQASDKPTVLQTIESMFPQPFLTSLSRSNQGDVYGTSQLVEETLDAVIAIRTQIVITVLKSQAGTEKDPGLVLHENLLKPWDVANFRNIEREDVEKFQEKTITRAESISECLRQDMNSLAEDDLVDFDRLDSKFPWVAFVQSLGSWVGLRAQEINSQCITYGGIVEMATEFQELMKRGPQKIHIDQVQSEQHFNAATLPEDEKRAVFQKMKRSIMLRKSGGPKFPQPSNIRERPTEENDTTAENIAVLEEPQSTIVGTGKLTKPKSRSMMDRQPNATKVVFESQDAEELARSKNIGRIGLSQEDEFQQDTRSTNTAARRAAAAKVQAVSKKRAVEPPSAQFAPTPPKRQRLQTQENEEHNPVIVTEDTININEAENSGSETGISKGSYRALSQQTIEKRQEKRELAESLRSEKKQRRGKRLAWTERENTALLDGIATFNCKWSRIKERDSNNEGLLNARDQGDLKDRARNMKYELLRLGVPLPENLGNVPLPKSQLDRLREMGVPDPLERLRQHLEEDTPGE